MHREMVGSGYGISEAEFASLLDDAAAGPRIGALLQDWGVRVDRQDPKSLSAGHREVQSDPERQYAVYQVAMDLWR